MKVEGEGEVEVEVEGEARKCALHTKICGALVADRPCVRYEVE